LRIWKRRRRDIERHTIMWTCGASTRRAATAATTTRAAATKIIYVYQERERKKECTSKDTHSKKISIPHTPKLIKN
jgi:hypothetical protein